MCVQRATNDSYNYNYCRYTDCIAFLHNEYTNNCALINVVCSKIQLSFIFCADANRTFILEHE